MDLCGLPAWLAQRLDVVEQRAMRLREIGHFRRPVVHLQVDVEVIVAVPRGAHTVVPQPLQIRGQSARAAAGDQQIPAELKIERLQTEIATHPVSRARGVHRSAASRPPSLPAAASYAGRAADGLQGGRREVFHILSWLPPRSDDRRSISVRRRDSWSPQRARSSRWWRSRRGSVQETYPAAPRRRSALRTRGTRGPSRRTGRRPDRACHPPAISVAASCERSIHTENVSARGRSAVMRTTIAWSG